MANYAVYRYHPFHHYAPYNHDKRQPTVHRMMLYELHIGRREGVEHHNGGHIPKGQLVMKPEVPVEGDISDEVDKACCVPSPMQIIGNVVQTSDDKPCGIHP